ncbi:hypothetical protein FRC09_004414 [Ceratobasidium sp. 395]|nr:hypothetical protein FRC09_004414 [Ceratobasidium sp. 395]
MTEPARPKLSGRRRRPTERLCNYDRAQGPLKALSKSVGRKETPPTTESQAAKRAKKQAVIAAARGNATLPGPLKPLKRTANQRDEEDEEEEEEEGEEEEEEEEEGGGGQWQDDEPVEQDELAGDDDEDSPLDHQLGEFDCVRDRLEWLYQALEKLGSRRNYRNDPDFQNERQLRKEWKRLTSQGPARNHGAPMSGKARRIQTGLTHVLKPSTSGHSSRVQLVRTDDKTLGLDGKTVGSQDDREYGHRVPVKLARTDNTTIGLDGRVVSSPRRQAPSKPSRPALPSSAKPVSATVAAPPKKRALVPLARIQALRKENGKTTSGAKAVPPVNNAPASSKSKPKPPPRAPTPDSDVQMHNPPSGGPGPLSPQGDGDNRPLTPTAGQEDGAEGPGDEDETSDQEMAAAGDGQGDEPDGSGPMRQRAQLSAFSADARGLVRFVTEQIKLDMATICAYPETMTEKPEDNETYFERWIVKHWTTANVELRDGQAPMPILDEYVTYIRNQLPVVRNGMKKIGDALVRVFFELSRSDPHCGAEAKSLTDGGDERWTSSNLKNDEDKFKHPVIRETIIQTYFNNPKSLGYRHLKRFAPIMPVPTIAYACSILRNRIKAYEVENSKAADLDSTSDSDAFSMYMRMLEGIRKNTPGHLIKAQLLITSEILKSKPQASRLRTPPMNYGPDCDIDMEELEEIYEMYGGDVAPVEEWDGVQDALNKSKGKGKASAKAGPSGSNH